MSLTVGRLAAKFGLSRSTLLYYDTIGLLTPSCHRKGEYRLYDEKDEQRLEKICLYRRAGVSLKRIKRLLDSPESSVSAILHERFDDLSREIERLHEQQRLIAGLLENPELLTRSRVMSREVWSELLRGAGYSDLDMKKWHIHFENTDPDKHLAFLRHLGIPQDEIEHIRNWSLS